MVGGTSHETKTISHRIEIDDDRSLCHRQRLVHFCEIRGSTAFKVDGNDTMVRGNTDHCLVGGAVINTDELIDASYFHGPCNGGLRGIEHDKCFVTRQPENGCRKGCRCHGSKGGGGGQCEKDGLHVFLPCVQHSRRRQALGV